MTCLFYHLRNGHADMSLISFLELGMFVVRVCIAYILCMMYGWMNVLACCDFVQTNANLIKSARYARHKYENCFRALVQGGGSICLRHAKFIEGAQRCGPQSFALSGNKHLRTSQHQWIITAVDGRRTCDFDVPIRSVPESFSKFELSPPRECFQMLPLHPRNILEPNSGEKTSLRLWHLMAFANAE